MIGGQMGGKKTVRNPATSSSTAIVFFFSVTFLAGSFSDAFPLFLRDFALIVADKQRGFPVDGSVSNAERARLRA